MTKCKETSKLKTENLVYRIVKDSVNMRVVEI